ncbi:MAG: F0F1 ATP synthase subunit epsilon [Actinomycetes bacterium]
MAELTVDLVAADRAIWSGTARLVIARTLVGDIGILPGHEPVLASLADSVVIVRSNEGDQIFAVHGGFMSVSNDMVSVLAETAEFASEIDVVRAQRALERAQAEATRTEEPSNGLSEAQHRAETRLRAAEAKLTH